MDIAEIQRQIDVVIRLIELLNRKVTAHDRLRRQLSEKIMPPIPERQCVEHIEKWWSENAQPLIDGIRKRLEPLRCEIEAYWSEKYSWDSFCGMLDYARDNYDQWKARGGPDIHIQELQAVSRALASTDQKPNGQKPPSETSKKTAGGRRSKPMSKATGKSGRKPAYTVEFCRLVQNTYDEWLAKGIGSKGAWHKAAETHGIKSGDAARVQCNRYLKPKMEQ